MIPIDVIFKNRDRAAALGYAPLASGMAEQFLQMEFIESRTVRGSDGRTYREETRRHPRTGLKVTARFPMAGQAKG